MQVELKPCPFCGEQCAVLDEDIKWAGYQPSCLEVRTGYDSSPDAEWRSEAIAAWNRRAGDSAEVVGEIERLEERLAEAYQLAGHITLEHGIAGPDVERLLDLLAGVNLSGNRIPAADS